MLLRKFLPFLLLSIALSGLAQEPVVPVPSSDKFTLSGYVKDKSNGESMFSATVYVKELGKGATTNDYGFYSLTLPKGTYTVTASFLGYNNFEQQVVLDKDIRLNIDLSSMSITTDAVEVTSERKDRNVESTDMGKVELATEEIKSLPALLGEVDIMRSLQLLPGVMSAGEGNSGFYVRGGGPDQNLVLLDNAVVYNTGHLFGFFSVFNSDAIKSTSLIKGGMPAEYGGRISSVIDVQMKEGNMKEWQFEGGIGLISSRLTVQGPLKKDKAAIIVSGRRTYIDLITKPILKRVQDGKYDGNAYYFYDLNGKINYRFSDKDRLYLSGYFGRDVFDFKDPNGTFNISIPWGNSTASLRWNHLFSDKLFMNITAIFNDYQFKAESDFKGVIFKLSSGVRDYGASMDFDYFPHTNHAVKFGAVYTHHTFTPYTISGSAGDADFTSDDLNAKQAHEGAIYVQDDWTISDRVKINIGLRGSIFSHVGPLEKKVFNENGQITDTLTYGRGENIATYGMAEPRISTRIRINEFSSVKAGITLNNQYIHLVSSSTTTLPTDLWVPSSAKVKPQLGIQYALGYFHNFKDNMFETSVEVYYKDLRNQIEYGESFAPELNVDVEEGFVFGKGYAYGAEFFVKKTRGKFNGWIGYTISNTRRKFPDINKGNTFPAKFDRRHDLSVVAIYEINKRWKLSALFVFGTGQATTLPIGRYYIEGKVVNQYGERNSYRMAPYHRMDLSATYIIPRKKYYSDITMSIYNLYNRMNPYFIYYDVTGDVNQGDIDVKAKQASLFPILPSITWNFKF
ncbi:MAG: TonB-dependent receptor [Chitinophagales bacterium]|nr:TonB-dependent receptor [Chitinophagales bacterium]